LAAVIGDDGVRQGGPVGPSEPVEAGAEQEPEVVDGVVVLATARTIDRLHDGPPPFVTVAAVAATGFVAGAATAAVLGRHFARHQARRSLPSATPAPAWRGSDSLEVVSSRRFLVDVHTLARR
jgi:hypothetical protein